MARFIHGWKMYERIPMQSKSVLPDAGFEVRNVEIGEPVHAGLSGLIFPVYCLPKPNKGYAKHRVMVICDCGRHVPFGRMGQHYDKGKCKEVLDSY